MMLLLLLLLHTGLDPPSRPKCACLGFQMRTPNRAQPCPVPNRRTLTGPSPLTSFGPPSQLPKPQPPEKKNASIIPRLALNLPQS